MHPQGQILHHLGTQSIRGLCADSSSLFTCCRGAVQPQGQPSLYSSCCSATSPRLLDPSLEQPPQVFAGMRCSLRTSMYSIQLVTCSLEQQY